MKRIRRRVHRTFDSLEPRGLMATWGTPWPDASQLTMSFAPDGTAIGSKPSNLFQSLQALNGSGKDWQLQVLRAFQTWAAVSNVNIGLTADDGSAFGTPGALQRDGRFGDIRIGAFPQSDGNLIQNQPFDYAAGTWAGDVSLNAAAAFGIGDPSAFDLYTAMLDEAGNVLGLPDTTTDQTSALFYAYDGPRTGLSAADVQQIQALYGARTPDAHEGLFGNDTASRATPIGVASPLGLDLGNANITVRGGLQTTADKDYYKFNTGLNLGGMTIQLNTSGLSLLQARLSVYSGSKLVASTTSTDPRTGDLSIHIPRAGLFRTYTIVVQSGTSDVFGVGDYLVRAVPDGLLSGLLPWNLLGLKTTLEGVENGVNNVLAGALGLLSRKDVAGAFEYMADGSLNSATDRDFYRFLTPAGVDNPDNMMTVAVWGLDGNKPDARVRVYDPLGRQVSSRIIAHQGGTTVVQVADVTPNAMYAVDIEPYDPVHAPATGRYQLGIDFETQAEDLTRFDGGLVSTSASSGTVGSVTLDLDDDRLYDFVLDTGTTDSPSVGSMEFAIVDSAGVVVKSIVVLAGQAESLQIWLDRGIYTLRTRFLPADNAARTSPITWTLWGTDLSGPIRPYMAYGTGSSNTTTTTTTPPPP